MRTRLLINEATLYGAAQGGIARYMRHVAQAAAAHYGGSLAICSAHRMAPPPAKWIPSPRFRGSGRLHTTDIISTIAAALLRPRVYFGGYYGTARTSAREVFPVYDLTHELFYAGPGPDRLLRRLLDEKRRCLERAAALLAISHNTAADIVRLYPQVDPAKIVVTYLGVDAVFFSGTATFIAARPYFLFVGIRHLAKNFMRLIEAFGLSGVAGEFDLLVVSPAFTEAERAQIDRCGVQASVKLMPPVPDAELANLYASSVALLYPSEYEGFGLPVLEAMAAGTLVAASSTSSLPEVGGNVAFDFDPHDVTSMAEAIHNVANLGANEREQRRRNGMEWARTFTWSRCEAQTLDVFDRLLSAS